MLESCFRNHPASSNVAAGPKARRTSEWSAHDFCCSLRTSLVVGLLQAAQWLWPCYILSGMVVVKGQNGIRELLAWKPILGKREDGER